MTTDFFLLSCHQKGFLVGPNEDEDSFLSRISLLEEFSRSFTFEGERIPSSERESVNTELHRFFGCTVDWIPVFYSDKNLPFWQGGATWIDSSEDDLVQASFIQIKKRFQEEKYLSFYKKEEILLHEMSHGIRMAFTEPRFEEVLAYRTSRSPFRRFFGPIFRTSKESYIVVISFMLSFLLQVVFLFYSWPNLLYIFSFFPFALIGFYLYRLCFTQRIFLKCLQKLENLLPKSKIFPFIFCLTDKEIDMFSKKSLEEIKEYIREERSLRWRQIRLSRL